jgi:hypothetical protein
VRARPPSVLSRVLHLPAEVEAVARVIWMTRLVLLRPRVSFLALLRGTTRANGEMDLEQTRQARQELCSPINTRPAVVAHALRRPHLPTRPYTILAQMLFLTMRAKPYRCSGPTHSSSYIITLHLPKSKVRAKASYNPYRTILMATPSHHRCHHTTHRALNHRVLRLILKLLGSFFLLRTTRTTRTTRSR